MQPDPIVTLQIQELSKEACGYATWHRPDGLVRQVVVPYTLPGEEIEAVIRKTKRIYVGAIHQIVKKSVHRVDARCIHFGSCGGCSMQHMAYEAQLAFKERAIRALFEKNLPLLR